MADMDIRIQLSKWRLGAGALVLAGLFLYSWPARRPQAVEPKPLITATMPRGRNNLPAEVRSFCRGIWLKNEGPAPWTTVYIFITPEPNGPVYHSALCFLRPGREAFIPLADFATAAGQPYPGAAPPALIRISAHNGVNDKRQAVLLTH